MSKPLLIIETQEGEIESIYSNTELSIFLLEKADSDSPEFDGPYSPTLVKVDLPRLYDDQADLDNSILNMPSITPFY